MPLALRTESGPQPCPALPSARRQNGAPALTWRTQQFATCENWMALKPRSAWWGDAGVCLQRVQNSNPVRLQAGGAAAGRAGQGRAGQGRAGQGRAGAWQLPQEQHKVHMHQQPHT